MITAVKTVLAHRKALYWKTRMEKAEQFMRKNLAVLAEAGTGKHETEYGFFVVSENNSYPATLIAEALTEDERAMCYESKWSNARAKVLFPKAYNAAKVEQGFKVSI